MPTYNEWYELEPGGEVTWSEIWYPVAGIGGVTQANEDAALALRSDGKTLRIGIFPTSALQGQVKITIQGMDPVVRAVDIDPSRPFTPRFRWRPACPRRPRWRSLWQTMPERRCSLRRRRFSCGRGAMTSRQDAESSDAGHGFRYTLDVRA